MEFSREVLAAELERRTAIFHKVMERNSLAGMFFTSTAQQAYQMGCKYLSGYALSSRRDIAYVTPGSVPCLVVPTIGQQSSAQKVSWLPPDHILSDELPAAAEKFMRSLPGTCPLRK